MNDDVYIFNWLNLVILLKILHINTAILKH